jgi:hypothetical protein
MVICVPGEVRCAWLAGVRRVADLQSVRLPSAWLMKVKRVGAARRPQDVVANRGGKSGILGYSSSESANPDNRGVRPAKYARCH